MSNGSTGHICVRPRRGISYKMCPMIYIILYVIILYSLLASMYSINMDPSRPVLVLSLLGGTNTSIPRGILMSGLLDRPRFVVRWYRLVVCCRVPDWIQIFKPNPGTHYGNLLLSDVIRNHQLAPEADHAHQSEPCFDRSPRWPLDLSWSRINRRWCMMRHPACCG